MTERGSAVAAGGPAREQTREAVPDEAGCDRRTGRREVRPPTEEGGRQPSRCLRACVTAEAEARAEAVPARRCLRGGAEGLAGKRGTSMRPRAAGRSWGLVLPQLR